MSLYKHNLSPGQTIAMCQRNILQHCSVGALNIVNVTLTCCDRLAGALTAIRPKPQACFSFQIITHLIGPAQFCLLFALFGSRMFSGD